MSKTSRTQEQSDSSVKLSSDKRTSAKKSGSSKSRSSSDKAESIAKKTPKSSKSKKAENSSKTYANSAKQSQKNEKSEQKEAVEQRSACKTPQVMRLVEKGIDVNPVLLAGKSRIPSRLRGKEPLTKLMRRGLGEEFDYSENSLVVNITELAIEQEAPIILDRFNACSCDKCVEEFSKIIAGKVPVRFARIDKNGRSPDNRDLSERVAPMRKVVLTEMIKELIGSKKRCFHDDK